jgi:spore germination cell wall hydrolase CwlJ-like protein
MVAPVVPAPQRLVVVLLTNCQFSPIATACTVARARVTPLYRQDVKFADAPFVSRDASDFAHSYGILMFQKRPLALLSATGAMLVVSGLAVATVTGSAAQSAAFPVLSYDVETLTPADAAQPVVAAAAVATPAVSATVIEQAPIAAAALPTVPKAEKIDAAALDCMAKVVHHEARNQPREGQVAVAQTLLNRIKVGIFGGTVCEVANQHGQFFNTSNYQPNRDSDTWTSAVDVSRAVLRGDEDADEVAPGAVYFRAAYRPANSFFRTRQRVGAIGDHIFYR